MGRAMGTPKPGEIRCPTCHRSTPPATYCTQCGSPIPSDARARPRGLDRDELQDRIRQRRGVGDPFRRGVGGGGYQPFRPEPGDAVTRRPEPQGETPRVDLYADPEPAAQAAIAFEQWRRPEAPRDSARAWRRGVEVDDGGGASAESLPPAWAAPDAAPTVGPTQPLPPAPAPPPAESAVAGQPWSGGQPIGGGEAAYATGEYVPGDDRYAEPWEGGGDVYTEPYEPGYPYRSAYPYEERGGGVAGPLIVVGFLVLGVLALLGGAAAAGLFNGDGGVAQATPTLALGGAGTQAPAVIDTPLPEVTPPPAGTPVPSPTGGTGSDEPVVFDDGFTGEIRPCATPEMGLEGCVTDGSTLAGDSAFMWVGFDNASPDELLQVLISNDGSVVFASEESRLGQFVSCAAPCGGYIQWSFTGLTPGEYEVELRRNGETADRASMRVEG